MKKLILLVAMVATTIAFTSCANEDPAKPVTVSNMRTGVIEGFIVMPENLKPNNNGKVFYSSPENIEIVAKVVHNSQTLAGTHDVTDVTYNKLTGKFTIVSPAAEEGSDVTVILNPVYGSQQQYDVVDDKWISVDGVFKDNGYHYISLTPRQVVNLGTIYLTFEETVQNESEM